MPEPVRLTREQWGGRRNTIPFEMVLPADDVWVHHSVTNEDIGVWPTEDAIADFLELDALGVAGGISYSWAIHPNGIIGEGQGTHQGAHTGGNVGCNHSPYGWNPCSFGVCFIGDFHPRESNGWQADELTDEAINSFRWLMAKLVREGHLAPDWRLGGHRDAPGNSTACPGDNIAKRYDELRAPYQPAILIPHLGDTMAVKYSIQVNGVNSETWYQVGDYVLFRAEGMTNSGWTECTMEKSKFEAEVLAEVDKARAGRDRVADAGGGPVTIGLKVL